MKKLLTNEETIKKILMEDFNDNEINLFECVNIVIDAVYVSDISNQVMCCIDGVNEKIPFNKLPVSIQQRVVSSVRKTRDNC